MGQPPLPFSEGEEFFVSALQKEELFANKIHAYTRPRLAVNSRVEDLIDMALLIAHGLSAAKVLLSIEKVFAGSTDHQLILTKLPSPPPSWKIEFEIIAERRNLQLSLEQAFQRVTDFYTELFK